MARRENPGGSPRPTATTSPTSTPASTVAQEAKEQVRNLAGDARREASNMASQAGNLVQGLVGKQKDQAAQRLGSVAGALRDVGNRLDEQDGAGLGQYAVRAADQVDRLSGYLRDRDLKTFVQDTERFARRHPDVFLGGTFLAGLVLARFLKSSSSDRDEDWNANAYASHPVAYEGQTGRSRYAGEPFDDVNPQAYASHPGERFGRGAELGGPPEPYRSEDRPGPYGTPDGVRYPDTPEGG